jgi:hypothetical protein
MVLTEKDRSNPRGRVASEAERLAFDQLLAHFQLADFFKYDGPLTYSWDHRRKEGTQSLLRLDRFYTFAAGHGVAASHIKKYNIKGDCSLSDHLPVVLSIEIEAVQRSGSRYKINEYYLSDKQVVADLARVWTSQLATLGFFGKLRRTVKWYNVMPEEGSGAPRAGKRSSHPAGGRTAAPAGRPTRPTGTPDSHSHYRGTRNA